MLSLAGLSHKTAPLDVRERLAFPAAELLDLLPPLRARFGPAVVLSTCNRTEIYCSAADAEQLDVGELAAFISAQRDGSPPVALDHFYSLQESEAVRHLFRVAAGLDSMVIGEAQILGQVGQALHLAQRAGVSDSLLTRLFQSAVAAGRRGRNATSLAGSATSVSAAAVDLARELAGDLAAASVLVVSAGEAAKLTAWSMSQSGAGRIVIAGRTVERARRIAADLGATAIGLQSLPSALADADIVVTSTGARGFCIDRATVATAMTQRPDRPLLVIDLAVPRDVDPSVSRLPNVRLYDVDGLQPLVDRRASDALGLLPPIEATVEDSAARFMDWRRVSWAVPTIAALRERAEGIRRAELAKTFARLPNLSGEERQRIDALTAAIIKKLLHHPIVSLKEPDSPPEHADAIRELFALEPAVE